MDIGALRAPMLSCLIVLGVFALFLLGLALFERLGLDPARIPVAAIAGALVLAIVVAFMAHGRRPADYYAADGIVVARISGLAGASVVVGLLLIAFSSPSGSFAENSAAAGGMLAGMVGSALLIAPRLRRFKGYTLADFFLARFGERARIVAAIAIFAASILLLAAGLVMTGPLLAGMAGADPSHGIWAAAFLAALLVLPGGMRALTWTQFFLYFVVLAGCLAPAAFLALHSDDVVGAGGSSATIASLLMQLNPIGAEVGGAGPAFLLFAAGAAALPPVLGRAYVSPSPQQSASSLLWAVLFVLVVLAVGLVLATSLEAVSGLPASAPAADLLAWSMPLFAALPVVLAALVMAGTVAALLAACAAALFSASAALSHDLWNAAFGESAREGRRIFLARLLLAGVAAGGAWLAIRWPMDAAVTLGWSLALSASGLLIPMLAGLWWPRCNGTDAMFGIAAAAGVVGIVMLADIGALPLPGWIASPRGHGASAAAALGVVAAFVVTVASSFLREAKLRRTPMAPRA
jgi:cation/acetate symporter